MVLWNNPDQQLAAFRLHPKCSRPALKCGNMGYAHLQMWNSNQPALHLWSRWKQFSWRSIVKVPCSTFLTALTLHQDLEKKKHGSMKLTTLIKQVFKKDRAFLQLNTDLTVLQSYSRISSDGAWQLQLNYCMPVALFSNSADAFVQKITHWPLLYSYYAESRVWQPEENQMGWFFNWLICVRELKCARSWSFGDF